jgi:hypothetical protein
VAAKQATGMVEKVNDILQRILNKTGELYLFAERLQKSVLELNRREIIHLDYSPFEIHRGNCLGRLHLRGRIKGYLIT